MKKVLRPVASLYLTVPLLALSILLVFAGTLAQRLMGIDDVVSHYFRSWIAWIDPRIFFPGVKPGGPTHNVIPYFGGRTLVLLLLVNLLAAHTVRFKLNWKRSGILLTHFSLIMLLGGELISGHWATESQVQLSNGQSSNFTFDVRKPELAVMDQSAPDHDNVTVVGGSLLKTGAVIDSPRLPFQVRIDNYYPNSDVLGPNQAAQQKTQPRATAGEDSSLALVELPPAPGTDSEKVDMPSAYVTLDAGGRTLGTYLLSTDLLTPQHVDVNGKQYAIALRFERFYKPYTLTLLKFSHDRYLGSDEPKNFSSRVRLVDAAHHVDREVLIWMNHPLRYAGDTIYQEGFGPGDKYTTLQIASNPTSSWAAHLTGLPVIGSWLGYLSLPLLACFMGALGLLIHFGIRLSGFMRRVIAEPTAPPPPVASAKKQRTGNYQLAPTTVPLWARPSFWTASIALLFGAFVVGGMAVLPTTKHSEPYDLEAFGKLPIVSEGRVLPIDSLARNTLRIVSGHETLVRDKRTVPAIQWILDAFTNSSLWRDDKIFRIDHPDIVGMLHLDTKEKYFSANDLSPHLQELSHQSEIADKIPLAERDAFQSKVLQLFESVRLVEKVVGGFENWDTYVVPPTTADSHWMTLNDVVKQAQKTRAAPQAAMLFTKVIEDYHKQRPASFNADVRAYAQYLHANVPAMARKSGLEAYVNAFDPFMACIVLYAVILILGFISWLAWQKPLTAASLALLTFTFIVHSFGLGARIWMQGRPPVTNLYSSSVFIGWGVVLLCILLELVYRNGIASVTAAIIGFVTLVIALHLSSDATLQPNGDTMAVMRAVLDTNLWLATHVVCITLGYASTFLAGSLALVYVTRGVATPSLDSDLRKTLSRMIYAIVCFAMFFSFVGTILGGIWAEQSWGRFWGWDPKENGAILIVLWNALILHARWSGMVRERGMALLAIFGNVVTSWSWFGTNMLSIGLHSYGFMDAALPYLLGFDGYNVAMIFVGLIPMRLWRSFESPTNGRGFAPVLEGA